MLAIAVAAIGWQCIGAWTDSQTTDEAAHLGAGYSYWRTGDFRLNPEHPPLIKLLASWPLLALPNLNFDTSSQYWNERNQWLMGAELLYGSFAPLDGARLILFIARWPMIAVWAGLGWLLWHWSRRRWGEIGALLSVSLFAFDPNWLGHGHLVATDVGVALGFLATIWALEKTLSRPTWHWIVLVSLIFGLTQLTKFSAVWLWLIVPLIGLLRIIQPEHSGWNWRWWRRLMASLVIVTSALTWTMYGFEIKPPDADPRIETLWADRTWLASSETLLQQPMILQWLVRISDPGAPTGQALQWLSNQPIPAYSYWRGLFSTLTHNAVGHASFLFGQTSERGWWWYFPAGLALKTPFITIAAILLAGIMAWLRWRTYRRWVFSGWLLALPPGLFFLWSLGSHINIGVRHVFPIWPFLWLGAGSLGAPWPKGDRWRIRIVGVFVVGIMLTSLLAWPNTIGYFNFLAGGTENAHRYLLDSNLDWNQDILRLRRFLDQRQFSEVHLTLFGSIPAKRIFPETTGVLTDADIRTGRSPTGIVIISAGQLFNRHGPFSWLRSYDPAWRIGSSIWVFDFR